MIKKLLLLLIFINSVLVCSSKNPPEEQRIFDKYGDLLTNQIAQITNGYIDESLVFGSSKNCQNYIVLPSDASYEKAKLQITDLVNGFADLFFSGAWNRVPTEEDRQYMVTLRLQVPEEGMGRGVYTNYFFWVSYRESKSYNHGISVTWCAINVNRGR